MKAEERKALETNVLADQLGRAMEGLKQPPPRSLLVYLGLAIAAVVLVVAFRWFYRTSLSAESQRWLQVDSAVFTEQLDTLLEEKDLKGSLQGSTVRLKEARLKLAQGLRDLGANPALAHESLDAAGKLYEELLKSKLIGRVELLEQEALSGAARVNEAVGEIDQAISSYKRLKDTFPKSALGQDAARQLERLESDAGRKRAAELARAFTPKK